MIFTWDTDNLCIVFRQWHIKSTASLVISLLLVVALTAGYEALRAASRRYENAVNKRVAALPSTSPLPIPLPRQDRSRSSLSRDSLWAAGGLMLRLLSSP